MKNGVWEEWELNYLKENYQSLDNSQIAKNIDRSKKAIQVKLSKLGMKRPKEEKYNFDKFKKIENEEDAYWFGFLFADGGLSYNPINRNYELNLELKDEDYKHIEKFIQYMDCNLKVNFRQRRTKLCPNLSKLAFVRIYSKEISDNLISNGFVLNKGKNNFSMPNIEKSLIKHFIRGFFDGDGSIYYYNIRNCWQGNITCHCKSFLEEIRNYLFENNINSYITSYINQNNNTIYQLQIKGKKNAIKYFDFIYKDCNVYLDRKYSKYICCLNNQ